MASLFNLSGVTLLEPGGNIELNEEPSLENNFSIDDIHLLFDSVEGLIGCLDPAQGGEEAGRNLTSSANDHKVSLEEHVEAEWGAHGDDDTEFLDSVRLYVNGFLAVYTTATKLN